MLTSALCLTLFTAPLSSGSPASAADQGDVSYGLLVDLWAADPGTGRSVLVVPDLPVGPALDSGAQLAHSDVSGLSRLTLPYQAGSGAYRDALAVLAAGLVPVLDGDEVPRDAALVVRAPAGASVELSERHPRVLAHPFEAGVIVIDPLVTEVDALRAELQVAPDLRGLPVGKELVLTVGGGRAREQITLRGAPAAMPKAGGVFGPPRVLGTFRVALSEITLSPPSSYLVDVKWSAVDCAQTPEPGDLFRTADGAHVFAVSTLGPVQAGGEVQDVECTLAAGDPATVPQRARGWHASAWNPQAGDDPDCYVRAWPAPAVEPNEGVDPASLVAVRFTEPIDIATAEAHDALGVALVSSGAGIHDLVAGDVAPAVGGTLLRFTPHQPFPHLNGTAETLHVLLSGQLRDLDGVFPRGTSVQAEFRGATSVGGTGSGSPAESPFLLDAYGDQAAAFGIPGDPANQNLDVAFLNGDDGWNSSLDDVDGARFVQVRLTFVADPATGAIPRLEAIGLSFQE